MSIELTHSAKYWRMRAEEFRTKADNCEHRPAKEALRKAARSYDELARRAEKIRTVHNVVE